MQMQYPQQAWNGLNQSLQNLVTGQMARQQAERDHKLALENIALKKLSMDLDTQNQMQKMGLEQERFMQNKGLEERRLNDTMMQNQEVNALNREKFGFEQNKFEAEAPIRKANVANFNAEARYRQTAADQNILENEAIRMKMNKDKDYASAIKNIQSLDTEMAPLEKKIASGTATPEEVSKYQELFGKVQGFVKTMEQYSGLTKKEELELVEKKVANIMKNAIDIGDDTMTRDTAIEQAKAEIRNGKSSASAFQDKLVYSVTSAFANLDAEYKQITGHGVPDKDKETFNKFKREDPFEALRAFTMYVKKAKKGNTSTVDEKPPVVNEKPVANDDLWGATQPQQNGAGLNYIKSLGSLIKRGYESANLPY